MHRIRLFAVLAGVVTILSGGVAVHASQEAAPTSTVFTRVLSPITHGQTAVLEGQVRDSEGVALSGVTVKLYSRSTTSKPWTYVTSATTGAEDGLFRFRRQPPQNFYYSVLFRGTEAHDSSSAQTKVEVRRKLTPTDMITEGIPVDQFDFTGPAKPTSKSRYKTVKLWRKKCDTCSWQTIASTRTNGSAIWRFRVSNPPHTGMTYWYKAYIPATSGFALSYSDTWRLHT